MNLQELDRLLQAWYEGTGSEEEEHRLFAMLKADDLPAKYATNRQILGAFLDMSSAPEPDSGFEARIMEAVDRSETEGRIVSLKRRVYAIVSVAASVLIILSGYFIIESENKLKDTFDDPVLAYNATLEVLQRVSTTLNTGSDAIENLSEIEKARNQLEMLSEPARAVSRDLQALKHIEKSISYFDLLKNNE